METLFLIFVEHIIGNQCYNLYIFYSNSQALKILRTAEFKPYVIFVKPCIPEISRQRSSPTSPGRGDNGHITVRRDLYHHTSQMHLIKLLYCTQWTKTLYFYFSILMWKGWRPTGHEAISRADGTAIWPPSGQGPGKGILCQCLCRTEEYSGTTREGAAVGACQLGPILILPPSLNSNTHIWCYENIDLSASFCVFCLPVSISSCSTEVIQSEIQVPSELLKLRSVVLR